jgi:chromosome segregation ATPase
MVGDADELEKQSKALKQAKIDVESYERQVGTAQRRWNDANETFNIATRAVEALNTAFESGSTEKKQAAYTALKTEADKLGIKVSDLNYEFSETDASTLTQRLIELKQRGLKPVTDAMDRAQVETREMGNTAKQAGKDVKESAEAYKEMNDAAAQRDAFESKIKSFLGVAGAAQVMRHALRDAMQTITELDKTMTEMSVVTDLEVGDYWDQLPQYTKRANELGLAINDVYKADTLYYQ